MIIEKTATRNAVSMALTQVIPVQFIVSGTKAIAGTEYQELTHGSTKKIDDKKPPHQDSHWNTD